MISPLVKPAAQWIERRILDGIVIHHIQADGAIAAAGVDCDSVGTARAADSADGGT